MMIRGRRQCTLKHKTLINKGDLSLHRPHRFTYMVPIMGNPWSIAMHRCTATLSFNDLQVRPCLPMVPETLPETLPVVVYHGTPAVPRAARLQLVPGRYIYIYIYCQGELALALASSSPSSSFPAGFYCCIIIMIMIMGKHWLT